jgi:hypothetical protein
MKRWWAATEGIRWLIPVLLAIVVGIVLMAVLAK